MREESVNKYPEPMLPNVDYRVFDRDTSSLSSLEHDAQFHSCAFLQALEASLIDAEMVLPPELIVAHLCCYLGAMCAVCIPDEVKELEPHILQVIQKHAEYGFTQFNQHLIKVDDVRSAKTQDRLEKLQANCPGSIASQTIRLGRVVMDMMTQLESHSGLIEQTECFCPEEKFIGFLIPLLNQQNHEWKESLENYSVRYGVNQMSIQIGWLIGYFSYLDGVPPSEGEYFDCGLSCVPFYRERMAALLDAMRDDGKVLTSMMDETHDERDGGGDASEVEELLSEISELSSKAHASQPPSFTDFQKQTAVVQASLVKLLMELITDGVAVKVIYMSLFNLWFLLDAPLRFKEPLPLDEYSPFDEMNDIIDIIKETTRLLPEPNFSEDIRLLNHKMQFLKSKLPSATSKDEIDSDTISAQSVRVTTEINELVITYLKQKYHVEALTNVMFNEWMHLSVFYGVSESEWQKMDYYLGDILKAVRAHISSLEVERIG